MTKLATDHRRFSWSSAVTVAAVSVVCFGIRIANPFNVATAWPAAGVSYASEMFNAQINSLVLYAGFQSRHLLTFDDRQSSPGGFLVVGLALSVIYGLALDLGYAGWLHSGRGIYSKGHFELASRLLGFGLVALPLMIASGRRHLPAIWRGVALVGGVCLALLAVLGLVEAVSYGLDAIYGYYLSESWEMLAVPTFVALGNLALVACGVTVAGLYLYDQTKSIRYDRIHYVPLFVAMAKVALGFATWLGYAFSDVL